MSEEIPFLDDMRRSLQTSRRWESPSSRTRLRGPVLGLATFLLVLAGGLSVTLLNRNPVMQGVGYSQPHSTTAMMGSTEPIQEGVDTTTETPTSFAQATAGSTTVVPESEGWWQLLGTVDAGLQERSPAVITAHAELQDYQEKLGVELQASEGIDFGTHIVVAFQVGFSEICPATELQEVVVQGNEVYADVSTPTSANGGSAYCTANYLPRTYFVALERAYLPGPPFSVRSDVTSPHVTIVETELRR